MSERRPPPPLAARPFLRRRLRLRTLLMVLGLLIFGLPLAGLGFLRVYDNQLVRHTEGELVAQGAFVVAAYRRALEGRLPREAPPASRGLPLDPRFRHLHEMGYTPVPARLNLLAERLRAPAEDALSAPDPAAPEAVAAGKEIEPLLRHAQRVTLAGIRVVDHQGVVVATTREEAGLSLRHREEVTRALAGENVSLLRARVSDETAPPLSSISRETGVRVMVALPVVAGATEHGRVLGAVVLARTPQSLGKAFYEDRLYLAGAALVLLVVVLAVTLLVAAFLVRPLGDLTLQAEEVAAGRPAPPPLRHAGTAEVARLSESFSRMARALEERADYIRSFAAAVSHEFKTPLTALQGTIELLGEHEGTMPASERARFMGNARTDIARLDRLVRRLLEMARADVVQPAQGSHPVAPAITAAAARQQSDQRPIALSLAPDLQVRMAPEVLETVLDNLITNAHQHGGPQAQVRITAAPEGADQVKIAVLNDGRPLSPANAERAFEPFFTTARDRGGTGLGLTIVRALVRAHGGSVELLAAEASTTAVVLLPAGE